MNAQKDLKVVLLARPDGDPTLDDFGFVEQDIAPLGNGELRLRTIYTSMDPAMRIAMQEAPSNFTSYPLGEVIGTYSVAEVIETRAANFREGDFVWAMSGWQRFPVVQPAAAFPIAHGDIPLTAYLGALGFTGFAAFLGLHDIGQPQPGETILISGASGAVGSMAGQFAVMAGLRVVGITSGDERCASLRDFGFDHAIDRLDPGFERALDAACPEGIDIFFDNTGGIIQKLAFPRMNLGGRVALCGMIANYSDQTPPDGPDLMPVLTGRVRIQGFNASDSLDRFGAYQQQAAEWFREGKIRAQETVVEGLENAPAAFMALLRGDKLGKLVLQVSPERDQQDLRP